MPVLPSDQSSGLKVSKMAHNRGLVHLALIRKFF
jgi:hypothetical protein